jgi:YHS domain-containing protein
MLLALLFSCTTEPAAPPPAQPVPTEPAATAMAAPDAHEHGTACDHEHGAAHVVAASVLPEFKNADGKLACPVMGDVVANPAEASGHADYEGVRYYFCCSSCAERFAQSPATFADGNFLRQEGIWPGGTSDHG